MDSKCWEIGKNSDLYRRASFTSEILIQDSSSFTILYSFRSSAIVQALSLKPKLEINEIFTFLCYRWKVVLKKTYWYSGSLSLIGSYKESIRM